MGFLVSMIVCDAHMEDVEEQAITTAPHLPHWWFKYADYTHTKLDASCAQVFTDHQNSLDPDNQFKLTTEKGGGQGSNFPGTNTVHSEHLQKAHTHGLIPQCCLKPPAR